MSRGVEAGKCILRHQRTATRYIRGRSSNTPPWITSPIIERREDEFGALMSWGFSQDSDGDCRHACGMQGYGDVV